jgi:predicted DNA-binding protein with PD1-like motif
MMHVNMKAPTRGFLARLDPGDWLHQSIAELARAERIDAALVRGAGIVEAAELALWDPQAQAWTAAGAVEGVAHLASLHGVVSLRGGAPDVRLHVVLALRGAGLPAATAGLLLRARAVAVELALDVFDEATVDRGDDPASGLLP